MALSFEDFGAKRGNVGYTAIVKNVKTSALWDLRRETMPTLKLAGPVVAGQVGIMAMSVVDTAMVRPLGAHAVGAVGVGAATYQIAFMFGLGVLFGLDRIVSVAWGAGDAARCRAALVQGLWLAAGLSLPLAGVLWWVGGDISILGVDPALRPEAGAYLRILSWSVAPTLLFTALRQSLQATGDVAAANLILVGCNLVNAVANYVFIHGALGVPAMGVAGAGWATLIGRLVMLVSLAWWAWRQEALPAALSRLLPDLRMLKELLRVGLPAGFQLLTEVSIFSLTTVLASGMGVTQAAAHHVVLQVASVAFMVPLGVSAAGAVRVGQALGANDPQGARRAGWAAVAVGTGFMCLSALVLLLAWRPILTPFASDEAVLALAQRLLLCAAIFQIFDGLQVALSGVLRGTGDTTAPLIANVVGHWLVGLPIAWVLSFRFQIGVLGLWVGLAVGLTSVAAISLTAWVRKIRKNDRLLALSAG